MQNETNPVLTSVDECDAVSIDLETLGTEPDAPMISLGAQAFNMVTGQMGPTFYGVVDPSHWFLYGGEPDGKTIMWWLKQRADARKALEEGPQYPLPVLLARFADFLTDGEGGVNEVIAVWGNGAAFDNAILSAHYKRTSLKKPWSFRNDNCLRTLRNHLDPQYEIAPTLVGTAHNALDDAIHQAKWAVNLMAGKRLYTGDLNGDTDSSDD